MTEELERRLRRLETCVMAMAVNSGMADSIVDVRDAIRGMWEDHQQAPAPQRSQMRPLMFSMTGSATGSGSPPRQPSDPIPSSQPQSVIEDA